MSVPDLPLLGRRDAFAPPPPPPPLSRSLTGPLGLIATLSSLRTVGFAVFRVARAIPLAPHRRDNIIDRRQNSRVVFAMSVRARVTLCSRSGNSVTSDSASPVVLLARHLAALLSFRSFRLARLVGCATSVEAQNHRQKLRPRKREFCSSLIPARVFRPRVRPRGERGGSQQATSCRRCFRPLYFHIAPFSLLRASPALLRLYRRYDRGASE